MTAVADDEVNADILNSLSSSLIGLLAAYANDDVDAFLAWMKEHGELPDPPKIENTRVLLRAKDAPANKDIAKIDGPAVLKRFVTTFEWNSHWNGILETSGCRCLWKATAIPSQETMQKLGEQESDLFGVKRGFAHHFLPVRQLATALETEREVLFADVKVVVQFDQALRFQPADIRLWYDAATPCWHPFQLIRAEVDVEGFDESSHLF